jgi:ParB family chromosome partitioning protein
MQMAAKKRSALGRDLEVLLGMPETSGSEAEGELRTLKLGSLQPGKYQPRKNIQAEPLAELVASIREHGVLDPILVRPLPGQRFEIIGGERRWRASQQAGLTEIPALVRELTDQQAALIALVENIQREDLAPLEVAQSLKQLIGEFKLTQDQAADKVGRSRAAVANFLRLLHLPETVKQLLNERQIEMGHARALVTLDAKLAQKLAQQTVEHGWSVRELEEAVRRAQAGSASGKKRTAPSRDADIVALERELTEKLAARVNIQHGRGGRGKLVIAYHSLDELEGILQRIR